MPCFQIDIEYYHMTISNLEKSGNQIIRIKINCQVLSIVRLQNFGTVRSKDVTLFWATEQPQSVISDIAVNIIRTE